MEYVEEGRTNIIEQYSKKDKKKIEKPVLQHGSIVYCKGHDGAGSFYGIVYENGVLEIKCASTSYIKTRENLHIGDRIRYWTIEYVCKSKLIIEGIIGEE